MKTFLLSLCLALPVLASPDADARKGIDAANARWTSAVDKGDAAAAAALYAEDATTLPPNSEAAHGRAAIRAMFDEMVKAGVKVQVKTDNVEAHGDMAIEVGTYTVNLQPPGKELVKGVDAGKYLVVWKKVQGKWLYYRDIWNTSRPAPSGPAASASARQ